MDCVTMADEREVVVDEVRRRVDFVVVVVAVGGTVTAAAITDTRDDLVVTLELDDGEECGCEREERWILIGGFEDEARIVFLVETGAAVAIPM